MTMKKLNEHIKRLVELARAYDEKGIKEEFKRIVPEYTPFEMEKQESEIEGQKVLEGRRPCDFRANGLSLRGL